jgi:hypothetical protein
MSALSGQQAGLPVPVNPRVAGLPPATEAPLSKRYRVVRSALQRESIPVLFRDWNWFPLLFAASIVAGVAPYCRHG